MSAAKRQTASHHPFHPAPQEETSASRGLTKVYWSPEEKEAFDKEAKSHRQHASEYARFILNARKDPLLFLQLCRLRDSTFAQGLMGNPADAGRVAELEKRVLELDYAKTSAEHERDEAARRAETAESRLGEALERQQALAGYVVDLARAQDSNRERAVSTDVEYESVPRPFLAIIKALTATPRLHRKDLEARLVDEGMTQKEASDAITAAARLDLVVKGRDMRYYLAKQPEGDDSE